MMLHRHVGISRNAARRIRHKLMQAMCERDCTHALSGPVQLDDARVGDWSSCFADEGDQHR